MFSIFVGATRTFLEATPSLRSQFFTEATSLRLAGAPSIASASSRAVHHEPAGTGSGPACGVEPRMPRRAKTGTASSENQTQHAFGEPNGVLTRWEGTAARLIADHALA